MRSRRAAVQCVAAAVNAPGGAAARGMRALGIARGEVAEVTLAFLCFFCLLCGYYVLRPVRDEMGIAGGVDQLHWVFTATFLAMLAAVPLYGAAAARLPRRVFVPGVYLFFILNLIGFAAALRAGLAPAWVARTFFVWTSVFNLFVVSVFWSAMADRFGSGQARRLFGVIAAGGSAGAVVGPTVTALSAASLGAAGLLGVSAVLLGLALACVVALQRRPGHRAGGAAAAAQPLGGGAWSGLALTARSPYLLGVGLFVWLLTTLATFLYFAQAHVVAAHLTDSAARTALFARIDLAVNALTIVAQLFVTGRLVARFGVAVALALLPGVVAIGFAALALAPVLPVLVAFQVLRRAGNYAVTRPAREMLFTVVSPEEKYKAKSFIDTVVYRGGDALSGWIFAGLKGLGLGLGTIALLAVPLALAWLAVGLALGRRYRARAAADADG